MNVVAGKERREKGIVTGNLLCNNHLNIKDLNCFNNTQFRGKSSQLIIRTNDAGPKEIWICTFMTLEKEKRKLGKPDAHDARFWRRRKESRVNQMQMMQGSTEKISRILSTWVMTIAPWK
jgi:hypothetical protein